MLLQSITLNNFRQYYLEQTIEFSTQSTRNVTVIHGENGSGKTALLNAFSWGLYGVLNLPNESQIINEQAINQANIGDKIQASVSLKFTDRGKKYTLLRSVEAEKGENNRVVYFDPVIHLEYRDFDGNSRYINNPTEEINRILPEDLRTYFFFDGERIDNLSKESGTEDVKKAIKNIMGLEIIERGINHTESARRKFRSELKRFGDAKTSHLIEVIDALEKEYKDLEGRRNLKQENIKANDKQIKDVEAKLKTIEGAKQLQKEREEKTNDLKNINNEMEKVRKNLAEQMSKFGYLAFSYLPLNKVEGILNQSSIDTTLTGIKEGFIDNLLSRGQCICGTEIIPGSPHHKKMKELRKYARSNILENKLVEFNREISMVKERKQSFYKELKELKRKEFDLIQDKRKVSEEIEEISRKLSMKDSEEIVDLENKREKLINFKSTLDREIGSIEKQMEDINKQIVEKEKERSKQQTTEKNALLAQKRIDACQKLEEVMAKILEIRESVVRKQLQERISNVYDQFLRKDYNVLLTEEYELNVVNNNGNIVGMSQGERQITSLSFIGAIVDIAREQYRKENKQEYDEGGIFPLVMDSPFGALDSDHRERIARGIHKLADQIVVIVSTSQWRGEVESQMSDVIGKEYKLIYNDPRQNKETPYEFTRVEEVQ